MKTTIDGHDVDADLGRSIRRMREVNADLLAACKRAAILAVPCPDCGRVEAVETTDGIMGRCSCADRPWAVQDSAPEYLRAAIAKAEGK